MAQRADREKEDVKRREAEERLEQAKLEEAVRRSEEEAKVRREAGQDTFSGGADRVCI